MRRPYEVLKKLRHLQKLYAEQEIRDKLSTSPENCRHNQALTLSDGKTEVRVCTLSNPLNGGQLAARADGRLIPCQKISQAAQCASYEPVFTDKNAVLAHMLAEDPFTRRRKYPDAFALNWVLDEDMHGLRSFSPDVLTRLLFFMISLLEKAVRRLNRKQNLVDPTKNTDE